MCVASSYHLSGVRRPRLWSGRSGTRPAARPTSTGPAHSARGPAPQRCISGASIVLASGFGAVWTAYTVHLGYALPALYIQIGYRRALKGNQAANAASQCLSPHLALQPCRLLCDGCHRPFFPEDSKRCSAKGFFPERRVRTLPWGRPAHLAGFTALARWDDASRVISRTRLHT
jgi:ribosomal protein L37E